jgi:hypothetical protein
MSTRRHLASTTALAAFVVLAFGSEATEDGSSSWDEPSWDEPAAADDDPAPAPAAGAGGSGDCSPWSGTGSPVASIEDLFDASKLQSMGRKLD